MISEKKFKRRGSIILPTILAAIIWVFIAQGLFITSTSGFAMLRSSREAMQAQQYAEIAIDKLKNIAYDQLDTYGAHSRTQITGISSTEWQDEVTIGSEADIAGSDGAKQRIATVNVYKKGDTIPRCTLDVPLSSLSSQGGGGIPNYKNASFIGHNIGTVYTIPNKGFVYISFIFYGWGDSGQTPKITINGFTMGDWYESSHAQGDGIFFIVDKGDKLSVTDVSAVKIFFIPIK